MRFGPVRMVVVSDPETIRRMHRERPARFRRTRGLEAVAEEMGLKGVFVAEGDDWLRQRKMVVMALNTARLKSFFEKLLVIAGRLQRRWERAADRGEPVDLGRDLMRLTVDVTSWLALGVDFNTLQTRGPVIQQNLDKVFPALHRRINAPFPYWRYFRLAKDRELDRALGEVRKQVDEIIREARERLRADPERCAAPANFLEAIIAAKEVKGADFSDAEIFANVCTLLLAGEDTTANTIAWAIDFFMRHPEHFARARVGGRRRDRARRVDRPVRADRPAPVPRRFLPRSDAAEAGSPDRQPAADRRHRDSWATRFRRARSSWR